MAITIRIPTPLRKLTNDRKTVDVTASTVNEAIQDLCQSYPGLTERICDEKGEVRRFINVYVNDEDIRFRNGIKTSLSDGDIVSLIPAIAGG